MQSTIIIVVHFTFVEEVTTISDEDESRNYMACVIITSIKSEVGCRDDTVPKTVDTRRHCEE